MKQEQLDEMRHAASMFSIHSDQLEAWAAYFIGFVRQEEKQDLNRFLKSAEALRKGFIKRIYEGDGEEAMINMATLFSDLAQLARTDEGVKKLAVMRGIIDEDIHVYDEETHEVLAKKKPRKTKKTVLKS